MRILALTIYFLSGFVFSFASFSSMSVHAASCGWAQSGDYVCGGAAANFEFPVAPPTNIPPVYVTDDTAISDDELPDYDIPEDVADAFIEIQQAINDLSTCNQEDAQEVYEEWLNDLEDQYADDAEGLIAAANAEPKPYVTVVNGTTHFLGEPLGDRTGCVSEINLCTQDPADFPTVEIAQEDYDAAREDCNPCARSFFRADLTDQELYEWQERYLDGNPILSRFCERREPPTVDVNTGVTVVEGGSAAITTAELSSSENMPYIDDDTLLYTVTGGPSGGHLELTTNPGVPITSFTQEDIRLGRVIYVHDGGEEPTDSFTFTLTDQNAVTPEENTFVITVTGVNEPPALTVNNPPAIAQGGTASINAGALVGTDVDDAPADMTYTASNITNGQLELTSDPGTPITSFTQDDVNNGLVVFVHDGTAAPGGFDASLADGGEDGAVAAVGSLVVGVL